MAGNVAILKPRTITQQRFEAKYFLREIEAQAVRDYMTPHMQIDPHTPAGHHEYLINSLYLDSPDLKLCQSSERGDKNRFKLRIRRYNAEPDQPVFFEIKGRMNQIVRKERVVVHACFLPELLQGRCFGPEVLFDPVRGQRHLNALYEFRDRMDRLHAGLACMVAYDREAWVSSRHEQIRISFDRRLRALPVNRYDNSIWTCTPAWQEINHFETVMEIKFTDSFPAWVSTMIRRFEFMRTSCAKYVLCVHGLRRSGHFPAVQRKESVS
jgi:hypothetical protein